MKISIIVPVYNEFENIGVVSGEIQTVMGKLAYDYEILFVDDGSSDDTLSVIKHLKDFGKRIFYISFSRNFGHQNAIRAGMEHSNGDCVITLDGDLQHPPSLIPSLLAKWEEGYDVVFTVRNESDESSFLKRFMSGNFYKIINNIADIGLKRGAADFRLLDRKVVDALCQFNEKDIFYRGLVSWLGYRQFEIGYTPEPRRYGKTKYSVRKMIRLALNGITSFSLVPLRAALLFGLFIALCSFCYGLYALYVKFFTDQAVSGWVSVMAGIYFLGGVQLVFFGICGEYIGRIFMETKRRPSYVISEMYLPHRSSSDN